MIHVKLEVSLGHITHCLKQNKTNNERIHTLLLELGKEKVKSKQYRFQSVSTYRFYLSMHNNAHGRVQRCVRVEAC